MNLSKGLTVIFLMILLNACSTSIAILDVAGTTAVYAGKTVVNTVDMITPDIINKEN
jgi:hypothetical protein|tara:strand:+ start:137 stop:307 length:171 start_codon:yes stop_codon:yes gene_type:complete